MTSRADSLLRASGDLRRHDSLCRSRNVVAAMRRGGGAVCDALLAPVLPRPPLAESGRRCAREHQRERVVRPLAHAIGGLEALPRARDDFSVGRMIADSTPTTFDSSRRSCACRCRKNSSFADAGPTMSRASTSASWCATSPKNRCASSGCSPASPRPLG